jgi:hypothetical protein
VGTVFLQVNTRDNFETFGVVVVVVVERWRERERLKIFGSTGKEGSRYKKIVSSNARFTVGLNSVWYLKSQKSSKISSYITYSCCPKT